MASEHQESFRPHKQALDQSVRGLYRLTGFFIDLKGPSITLNQYSSIAFTCFPACGFYRRSQCSSGSTISIPNIADSCIRCSSYSIMATACIHLQENHLKTSFIHNCHQNLLVFMLHKLICKNCICLWCLLSSELKTVATASCWFRAWKLSNRLSRSRVFTQANWDHED